MGAIVFLGQLFAGENGVFGVDDDDEITVVGMGGKIHLVLAPQDSGGLGGGSAHGFAGSIDDVPFALNSLSICHECGHLESSVYRDKCLIF